MASRAETREMRRKLSREIASFLKIQNHHFPSLVEDIKNTLDRRHQSYITYEIEVILYTVILKNVCSIMSMQEMSAAFNTDEVAKNIYKILGLPEKDYLPHYVTINECLAKFPNEELEKIRKKMIYSLIRKKSYDDAKFLNTHWLVIVDATQLFCFNERHCEHCLTKTINKGKPEEKTLYFHSVLEAKIVLWDFLAVSIATEFIENEKENPSKQDCERNSFKRLAESLKTMFPRLPICLLGDSLYACEPVFEICKRNRWEFLIRYKDGSIPTLAEDYNAILEMGEGEEEVVSVEQIFRRKPKVIEKHKMKWVNDLDYNGYKVSVMELEIEKDKKKWKEFQWVSSQAIRVSTAKAFADTGRKRWLIENEGFNIQKNHRYIITHANSLDYNAMKNHYLLTQLADILVQLYETCIKEVKPLFRTIAGIAKALLESLQRQSLTVDDLIYERMQVRKTEI